MTCRIQLLFILFIFTFCVCAESFVVNVRQSFYQAKENQSITMEWIFPTDSRFSLNSLFVFCQKSTSVKAFVLLHVHKGVEVPESLDKRFAGRVQLDKDVLRKGRVSLQLSRLRTTDSGLYVCKVVTRYGTNSGKCRLNVYAKDRPEPETTSSPIESSQPESRGRMVFYSALGLLTAAIVAFLLLALIRIYRRR